MNICDLPNYLVISFKSFNLREKDDDTKNSLFHYSL